MDLVGWQVMPSLLNRAFVNTALAVISNISLWDPGHS